MIYIFNSNHNVSLWKKLSFLYVYKIGTCQWGMIKTWKELFKSAFEWILSTEDQHQNEQSPSHHEQHLKCLSVHQNSSPFYLKMKKFKPCQTSPTMKYNFNLEGLWYRKPFTFKVINLLRSHFNPVVVVLVDGAPTGISPQCGPSTFDWMYISWWCVLGRR